MTYPVCPITIKKALEGIAGVNNVTINFEAKMVAVVFNPHQVRVSDLTEATNTAGYSSAVESKP